MIMLFVKIFFLLGFQILKIICIVECNKGTVLPPESEYHCSGLPISNERKDDKYCCFWIFTDTNNETIRRCSSIREDQYINLKEYINKKANDSRYSPDIDIRCREDQKSYCSNVVLDEEDVSTDYCRKLQISEEDDMYCCKWNYKNSKAGFKINNYCASINEYEYLTLEQYVNYKNMHPLQRYDDLTIDCFSEYLKISGLIYLFLILF